MYCTKCGSAVSETTIFCGVCGQAAVGPSGSAGAPPPYLAPPVTPPQNIQPYAAPPGAPPVQPYGFVALRSPYAGFWLRLIAHIIDGLLIAVGIVLVVVLTAVFTGIGSFKSNFHDFDNPDDFFAVAIFGVFLLVILILVAATWIYYAAMESSSHQGTLGKIALGLYVTDLQGRRITFGRASGRYFSKIITGIIPFALGYIMAGFTEKKQALHDMIAGCLVLRKN